jgi:chromosome segregation ATPase
VAKTIRDLAGVELVQMNASASEAILSIRIRPPAGHPTAEAVMRQKFDAAVEKFKQQNPSYKTYAGTLAQIHDSSRELEEARAEAKKAEGLIQDIRVTGQALVGAEEMLTSAKSRIAARENRLTIMRSNLDSARSQANAAWLTQMHALLRDWQQELADQTRDVKLDLESALAPMIAPAAEVFQLRELLATRAWVPAYGAVAHAAHELVDAPTAAG